MQIDNIGALDNLENTLKTELEKLGPEGLYLERYANVSGYFLPTITVMMLSMQYNEQSIKAKIAILFTEIEPAYCCPMISGEHHGICNIQLTIDMKSGEVFI